MTHMPRVILAAGLVASAACTSASAQDVYQNGLVANVYVSEKQDGTWASDAPVGIPIGSFVDAKVPAFSFVNLQQDDAAWALYPGNLIGVAWEGTFRAEEAGQYVLVAALDKVEGTEFNANSCIFNVSLSGKKVLTNAFKLDAEHFKLPKEAFAKNDATQLTLEPGYYPIQIWLNCGVTRRNWADWTNDDYDDATWTLKVKRPSDRILGPAPAGTLLWK